MQLAVSAGPQEARMAKSTQRSTPPLSTETALLYTAEEEAAVPWHGTGIETSLGTGIGTGIGTDIGTGIGAEPWPCMRAGGRPILAAG